MEKLDSIPSCNILPHNFNTLQRHQQWSIASELLGKFTKLTLVKDVIYLHQSQYFTMQHISIMMVHVMLIKIVSVQLLMNMVNVMLLKSYQLKRIN
jgi:hypothetical protein